MARSKKSEPSSRKLSPLEATRATLGKVFKDKTDFETEVNPDRFTESIPHIPTGSMAVDYLIGGRANKHGVLPCPGVPRKRIMQLWGHEAAGKSTLALTVAASVCQSGGSVLYLDWEHAVDTAYAGDLGVKVDDPNHFLLSQPNTMEDGLKIVWVAASQGVDLIVIDSVGAAVPEKVYNRKLSEMGDREQVGNLAMLWSNFLRRLQGLISKTGTAIIGISQVRANINTYNSYGNNETVQGGNAWKFWSSVRLSLRRVKTEKAKVYSALTHKTEEQVIGGRIKAKLVKCKVAPSQGQEIEFFIRQGEGIDDVLTAMEVGMGHGVIKRSGSWYTWDRASNDPLKSQGLDKLRNEILEGGHLEELYAVVRPYLAANGGDSFNGGDFEEEEEFVDPIAAELDDILSGS